MKIIKRIIQVIISISLVAWFWDDLAVIASALVIGALWFYFLLHSES